MSDVQPPIQIYPGSGSGFQAAPGWRFIRWLPKFQNHGELLVEANDLLYVDAWVATVLRTLCEFRARQMQTRVVIAPPAEASIEALLRDALGTDLPAAVSWGPREGAEDMADHPAADLPAHGLGAQRFPERVILPARRIYARATRRDICRLLPRFMDAAGHSRERSLICQAFSEFVDNALLHGGASSVGAIASVVCNPNRKRLELVVSDLGQGVPSASMNDFIQELGSARSTSVSAVTGLVASARKRDLPATFRFITNGYYIRCDALADEGPGRRGPTLGRWTTRQIGLLPGFTASVEIRW